MPRKQTPLPYISVANSKDSDDTDWEAWYDRCEVFTKGAVQSFEYYMKIRPTEGKITTQ